VCNRWAHNHTDEIQAAWINGVGVETVSPSMHQSAWYLDAPTG